MTGSVGRPGTHFVPTVLVELTGGAAKRRSPVANAPIISGLVPCNVIAEEILTDHPKRYRAMIVEAANPAHSLADSKRMREALGALDTLVVIDVVMSETAALADYVLPSATQFEKAEATFFNFDFPKNAFHLRHRLFPPEAERLPEAEIHARLVEALGALGDADYAPLREAAKAGLEAYAEAFLTTVMPDPRLAHLAPVLLYRTLPLEDDAREGAVLLGLAFKAVMERGPSVARAGFGGPPIEAALALFRAMIERRSGVVFAVDAWEDADARVGTKDGKLHFDHAELNDAVGDALAEEAGGAAADFPLVLSAGERRAFTANTILRDPAWRKKDADGALRISPADAARHGVVDGERVRLTTQRGSVVTVIEVSDTMQPGHVSLPNGLGTSFTAEGGTVVPGVAPNELTASEHRDPFVGTPLHKFVAARLERIAPSAP